MKKLTIILLVHLLTISVNGQTKYSINYSEPTQIKITSETKFLNENLYDVEFLNSKQQVIKSIKRTVEENHMSKSGYDFNSSVTYFFYKDTLKSFSITINITDKSIYKTTYQYQGHRRVGFECYSIRQKLSRDTITKIADQDKFLNFPESFPTKNLNLESKQIKKYENDKIVYQCYFERFGKLKSAIPAREQFYKYNSKNQLIEHISNPKSDAGGTAFLKQTFEYDESNNLIKKEWYENNLHQCTDEYIYTDSTIINKRRYYDIYGDGDKTKISSESSTVYKISNDGNFYSDNSLKRKFPIINVEE